MDISFVDKNGENKSVNTTAGTFKPLPSDGQHPLNCGSPFKRFRRTVVNMTRKDFLKRPVLVRWVPSGLQRALRRPLQAQKPGEPKCIFHP